MALPVTFVAEQKSSGAKVLVGRDPRFLGESFCAMAADILSSHGIAPLVIAEPVPTPAISYAVVQSKADGAINFTASHNPPEYGGIKFSMPMARPRCPKRHRLSSARLQPTTRTRQLPAQQRRSRSRSIPGACISRACAEIVDLDVIKKAGLKIAFDPMWGAARGYSDALLREAGVSVATVHDTRDVLFGGHSPEPDDRWLGDLRLKMREIGAAIGIATDGDADRFGIVDEDGTFLQPNYVIALLFDYLVESRGWKNGVGKSVATTNLINALAENIRLNFTKLRSDSSTLAS